MGCSSGRNDSWLQRRIRRRLQRLKRLVQSGGPSLDVGVTLRPNSQEYEYVISAMRRQRGGQGDRRGQRDRSDRSDGVQPTTLFAVYGTDGTAAERSAGRWNRPKRGLSEDVPFAYWGTESVQLAHYNDTLHRPDTTQQQQAQRRGQSIWQTDRQDIQMRSWRTGAI